MGKAKASKHVTSNISTAANPSTSSQTHIASNSSILHSSFAPFKLGATLFTSVIQNFDSQRLRIHDTSTGRLLCEHAVASRASITCLEWGSFGDISVGHEDEGPKKKKRKRSSQANGLPPSQNVVLAFGTSASEVQVYSPVESKILVTLKDAHSRGIRDFKFAKDGREGKAYSVGGDGKLVQWDLKLGTAIMSMTLPNSPASTILPTENDVICASHLAYLVDIDHKEVSAPYSASTNTVHTILSKSTRSKDQKHFLTIAEIDHSINVFEEDLSTLVGSLRTQNEVLAADLWWLGHHPRDSSQELAVRMTQPEHTLAALNKDGVLEIFPEPFDFTAASSRKDAESLKARMKNRSRPSTAQVKIVRPGKGGEQVPLIDGSFQGDQIALAWVEGGVNIMFDTIKWREEESNSLLLKGMTEVVQRKSGAGLGAVSKNGVKDMGKTHVNDSHAVVANGADADDVSMEEADQQVIDISSAEESSEFEEDEPVAKSSDLQQDAEDEEAEESGEGLVEEQDEDIGDAKGQDEPQEQEVGSPTFGDLIRANASDPIDVPTHLTNDHPQSLVPVNSTSVQPLSSGLSLGTVLTQSLRTNDTNLLESCFHTQDLSMVRATIERLDSSFATILLQRLAERLHSRPGRAGSLMVWIQWTLVAHGGYLAGQPEMMRKLRSLHKVVRERAGSLQSLLSLKGKLDMLEAQMNLRRSMLERGRAGNAQENEEEDESAVIYVEGQEEDDEEEDSDSEDHGSDDGDGELQKTIDSRLSRSQRLKDANARYKHVKDNDDDEEEEDEEEDAIPPTTNGPVIDSDSDNDDDDASGSDEDGMNKNEASETDPDSSGELDDEIDHESVDNVSSGAEDDDDDDDDDDDEGAASPPLPKASATRKGKGKGQLSNGIGSQSH